MEDLLPQGHIWQSVIQNAPYIIMIVDRQGTILYINHAVAGLRASEIPGKKLTDYIEPDYHTVNEKALKTIFEKGKSTSYTLRGTGPHGSASWYESVLSPIEDHGKVIAASIITHDISKQRQAEEQLKESERKFRVLAERSVDGIFSLDAEGCYIFVSPAVRRIAGYEPCEVMGKFFLDFIVPDDVPSALAAFDELTENNFIEGLELRIKKKDGSMGYVEINAVPILRDGEVKGIQGIVRDITFRKKAEELLRAQNEETSAILNVTDESIFIFDAQLRIFSVNATAAQRLGKRPQDLIGADARMFFSDEVIKRRLGFINKAIQTGEPQSLQDRRDGYWFNAQVYPIKNQKGTVDKLVVFARDITKEKERETLLKKSEQKYRTIFENSPEGIVLLDTRGNFIDINGRLYDWLGYMPKDVIGKGLADQPFFSDETKKELLEKLQQRLKKKNMAPYEIELLARDGHTMTGLVHGTLLHDEKGNITGDLVLISDISTRKELEKKIFEQEKLVALGRIAAMVSHELNTPLTNISLAIELVSSRMPHNLPEEVNTIKSEVAHASDIITRILGFSRTDDLNYSTVDAGYLVQEAIETLKKQNDTKKVTFNLPSSFSLPLQGDSYRLREVFLNILKNSLEAADPQKKNHTITIDGHVTDGNIILSIQDTGIGIEKKSLEKITDAFFTTKPLAEGTGLGLTIAQIIIKQHGGTLSINSIPQKGTTVTITLPQMNGK